VEVYLRLYLHCTLYYKDTHEKVRGSHASTQIPRLRDSVHVCIEIREIRIRPRLRQCKCWPCDALRQPRSPVWLKVLVSPGIASAY
jgi:hypothetical protein